VQEKEIDTKTRLLLAITNRNGKLEKNKEDQDIIRVIKQLRASGLSLRDIARGLNKGLVPTKKNRIWQAARVSNMLSRIGARR